MSNFDNNPDCYGDYYECSYNCQHCPNASGCKKESECQSSNSIDGGYGNSDYWW